MADDSFKSFVLDQLSALPELRARAMFGGHGLYSGERFFGILFDGRVYFKVDDTTRTAYEKHGMSPFIYEMKGREMTMSYYEVPLDVLEDQNESVVWASQAIKISQSAR
jgi:DNA transformation protein